MVALLMAAGANPEIENSEALKTDAGSEDEEDGEGDKAVPGHKPCHYAAGNTRVSHMTQLLRDFERRSSYSMMGRKAILSHCALRMHVSFQLGVLNNLDITVKVVSS